MFQRNLNTNLPEHKQARKGGNYKPNIKVFALYLKQDKDIQ